MMYSCLVDTYEPVEIENVLRSMISTQRLYLVDMDLGDYHWVGANGKRHIVERKTAHEIINDSGGRIDDQLRRYISNDNADVVTLLIEGEVTNDRGKSVGWSDTRRGYRSRTYAKPYKAVMAWIWSLQTNWNINIVYSENMAESAMLIGDLVVKSHKPIHQSLGPYPHVRNELKMPSTFVDTLMGVSNIEVQGKKVVRRRGVGEVTALKILAVYSTPLDAFNAPWEDMVKVIGKETTAVFFAGIGKYK
jgi:ERCC4-type nuclease